MSTREDEWNRIVEAYPRRSWDFLLTVWSNTRVLEKIGEQEWAALHAGVCARCGRPGRFYPAGWYCDAHPPAGVAGGTL